MNEEEFKVIEKVIESFFANDFCPNCGDIMTYSSHFCKVCNTRVSVPFSLGLKALNDLIAELKGQLKIGDFNS